LLNNLNSPSVSNSFSRLKDALVDEVGNNVSLSVAKLIEKELHHQQICPSSISSL